MRIAVLTSSRADYGIYLPLLRQLEKDEAFELNIIAFGTHLSYFHGYTIDAIKKDGFKIAHQVEHILTSDSREAVTTSMAIVMTKFATIWESDKFDLVFCLGDRYEMFAAVASGVPFGVKFAHLHGGETSLGAIDNVFRHSISLYSSLHFVSTQPYADRVAAIIDSRNGIHVVGALSLDNLNDTRLFSAEEFQSKYGIDITRPTILVTYHPNTIDIDGNQQYALDLVKALEEFTDHQVIITMPNADTAGNALRDVYQEFQKKNSRVFLVENFGTQGFFSCMKLATIMIGNSSSGIIEAASFGKYVVNIGDRQLGRAVSSNVIHCGTDSNSIKDACRKALDLGEYMGSNIYHQPGTAQSIVKILKQL